MNARPSRVLCSILALCCLVSTPAGARRDAARSPRPTAPSVISYERRLDLNRTSLIVTNTGSLGFDFANQDAGMWYPRGSNLTLLFASGLWLGASVNGETRVTVAEYSQEYQPGRIVAGLPEDSNHPDLQVWKVAAWRGIPNDTAHVAVAPGGPSDDALAHHSWSEYMAGAATRGAPWKLHRLPDTSTPAPDDSVDVPGPDVIGDRMTWCVFNDADPTAHNNDAGGTAPLGAEVEQTVFSFDDPGYMGDAVFIRWRIRNAGNDTWTGLRSGYWADPDIGGGAGVSDDKSGCDSLRSLAFAYNGQPVDGGYGAAPPVFGAMILTSLPPPPDGETSGLFACRTYVNGTDPTSAQESFFSLAGLAADGSELVDPFGNVTRYQYGGDPLTGTGWLDPSLADKRFLASTAPRDVAPGETLELWVALVVSPGPGLPVALAEMDCRADYVRSIFNSGFERPFPPPTICLAPVNCPRPANYWWMQATGAGAFSIADMDELAALVDANSVALDLGSPPRSGLVAVLTPSLSPSAQALREHAAYLCNAYATMAGLLPVGETPVSLNAITPVSCPGVPGSTTGELWAKAAEYRAVSGAYQNFVLTNRRALEGVDAGFSGFGGGAGSAFDFFGSTLDPTTQPDSFPAHVRVLFSQTVTQKAHRYLRLERASDGLAPPQGRAYLYGGYVPVPFTVVEQGTGDQLVAAIVERVLTDDIGVILPPEQQPVSSDGAWMPTDAADGGREYLFVFRRPYSDPSLPEFAVDGAVADGSLPGLFALWSKLRSPVDVIDDGDAFDFQFQFAFTTGSDAVLRDLALLPPNDPEALARYQQVTDCLGAINRAEGIGPTCGPPTAALASLVSAETEDGRIRIEWYLTSPGALTVERRVDDGEWLDRLTTSPDGAGRVVLLDTDVAPGHQYAYRLRLAGGHAGEVSLELLAQQLRLSLAGFQPNPATGPLSVSFSLASTAPARLEILDVAGRRVHARTLDRPVPGPQQLGLSGVQLAPGVYVIRLEQAGSRIVRRSVVLR